MKKGSALSSRVLAALMLGQWPWSLLVVRGAVRAAFESARDRRWQVSAVIWTLTMTSTTVILLAFWYLPVNPLVVAAAAFTLALTSWLLGDWLPWMPGMVMAVGPAWRPHRRCPR